MTQARFVGRTRRWLLAAPLLAVAACLAGDRSNFLAPNFDISDASHLDGTPGFFFLPPMVSQPAVTGVFDGDIAAVNPAVVICEDDDDDDVICDGLGLGERRFTTTSTPAITVAADKYAVKWDTREAGFLAGHTYRVHVLAGTGAAPRPLGFADVLLTEPGKAKNLADGETILLNDGRTLPIHFRIERGVVPRPVLACDVDRVTRLINGLLPADARRGAAHASFAAIRSSMNSGNPKAAVSAMFAFLRQILGYFGAGTLLDPTAPLGLSTGQATGELGSQLYACAGLTGQAPVTLGKTLESGGVAEVVVGPSEETQVVVTDDFLAGASFPPGSLNQTVLVTITPDDSLLPFPTTLAQYRPFYDFSTFPEVTFEEFVTVGICIDSAVLPEDRQDRYDFLQLAHPDPATNRETIEILTKVAAPFVCPPEGLGSASPSPATGWRETFARLVLPEPAHATSVLTGGLGGKTTSFSPFRAVDPNTAPVEAADLKIGSIGHSPASPTTATLPVTVSATVENVGGTATPPFQWVLKLERTSPNPLVIFTETQPIVEISPNGSAGLAVNVALGTAGDYVLTATADIQDVVVESDEANNSATHTFTVVSAAADLVISDPATLTVTPTSVAAGGTVTLSAFTVTNQGTASSNALSNGFYLSTDATITTADVRVGGNSNPALAPEASFVQGAPTPTIPAGTAPGSYFIGILVDEFNQTPESNEENNFKSTALTVTAALPDLIIQSFTHSPAAPTAFHGITFTAVVRNVGAGPAGPSVAGIDVGGEPSPGVTFAVPALAAGQSFTVSRQLCQIPQAYLTFAFADVNNTVSESNETNNTASDAYTVTAGTALVIDGHMCPGEWGESVALFAVNVPEVGTTPGALFVQNDGTNIYLAVRFARSALDPGNSLSVEFDSDNSNSLNTGDDFIGFSPGLGFSDLVRSTTAPPDKAPCPANVLCGYFDPEFVGGTKDGAGALRNDGTFTVYELSHPLNSGDAYDFSRSAGQTLGLFFFLRMIAAGGGPETFPVGFGDTRFPASDFLQVTISP